MSDTTNPKASTTDTMHPILAEIKVKARELALLIKEKCPISPELEQAQHHLSLVIQQAKAALEAEIKKETNGSK